MSADSITTEARSITKMAVRRDVSELKHDMRRLDKLDQEATKLQDGSDKVVAINELRKSRRTVDAFIALEKRDHGGAARYVQEVRALLTASGKGGGGCSSVAVAGVGLIGLVWLTRRRVSG